MAESAPAESAPAEDAPAGRPPGDRVRRRRPLTLRARLVLVLIGVVAVLCAVIGVVSTLAVYEFQLRQHDDEVRAAAERARRVADFTPPPEAKPPPPDFPRGQRIGTLQGSITGGDVTTAWIQGPAADESLTGAALAALAQVRADGRPRTVDIPGYGAYRLVALPLRDPADPGAAASAEPGAAATAEPRAVASGAVVAGLPLADLVETRNQLIGVEVAVGLAAVLLAAGAGIVMIRLTLRPLNRVAATAGRVTELPLARGEVALAERVPDADADPRTEVGRVGAALNRMLGHVGDALAARQASETKLRQFIADASHELRTPLAAIRGYTELSRRGLHAAPPEMVYAIDRVDTAAARMTTLVEDLLLLARLDAGRPLRREPVDLSALLVEAATDAHAAGPDHHWTLDLPAEAVTVTGDPDRLHQVVANLLANARVHTPAGTAVTVALRIDDGGAVVRVADDGPGIPPELRAHVFERFARADSSRSRTAGSSGLGLAIVASVVAAHRGRVEVSSVPGRTEFTMCLPLDGTS